MHHHNGIYFLLLILKSIPSSTTNASCEYQPDNGIYYSTYGGELQQSVVQESAFAQLEIVLSYNYIRGVSHYQNWSTLEISDGVYNFTTIDRIFDMVEQHHKYVILGIQQGVCVPKWVLQDPRVHTVDFVHGNPGWFPCKYVVLREKEKTMCILYVCMFKHACVCVCVYVCVYVHVCKCMCV